MAHFLTLRKHKPSFVVFLNSRNVVSRGEVMAFRPNTQNKFFSTDAAGFRHTVFKGERLSVRDIIQRDRYGLVLGSSNIFGLGTAGDENGLTSLLSDRFGLPFANVSLPEANSRNLFSQLSTLLFRAEHPPSAVLHFTGGDFTSFCYAGIADPVFGSPNLKQYPQMVEERGGEPNPKDYIRPLLNFTSMWCQMIVQACRRRKAPVMFGNDTTFFEKREPSPIDIECRLGTPGNPNQVRWFAAHKAFISQFYAHREALAAKLGVVIAGPGTSNDFSFFDEFHYDAEGTRQLAESVSPALEAMLSKPNSAAGPAT